MARLISLDFTSWVNFGGSEADPQRLTQGTNSQMLVKRH